jgi:hypothetical protein
MLRIELPIPLCYLADFMVARIYAKAFSMTPYGLVAGCVSEVHSASIFMVKDWGITFNRHMQEILQAATKFTRFIALLPWWYIQ